MHRRSNPLIALVLVLVGAACERGVATGDPGAPQTIAVEVSPPSAQVATGSSVQFAAAVTGTAATSVLWTVVEQGGGSIDTGGLYTAPATPGSYRVRATSVADPRAVGEAAVTVNPPVVEPPAPISVTVSPSPAALDACRTLTFTATVSNTANRTVTWSVQEGAEGGTITAAGVYTAPENAGTYHVVATSVADGTRRAVATVTVSDRVLSVTVNPPTVSVQTGATTQFTATVTTTCGSFVSAATALPAAPQ